MGDKDLLKMLEEVKLADLRQAATNVVPATDNSKAVQENLAVDLSGSFIGDVDRLRGGVAGGVHSAMDYKGVPLTEKQSEIFELVKDARVREMIMQYERSFEKLVEDGEKGGFDLSLLKEFKDKHVAWALMRDDSREFFALQTGHQIGGFLVVMPPNHTILAERRAIMRTENSLSAILIRPNQLSSMMTSVLMVHALASLRTNPMSSLAQKGVVPVRDESMQYALAMEAELIATDFVTGGRLFELTQGMAKELSIHSVGQVVTYLNEQNSTNSYLAKINGKYLKLIFGQNNPGFYENTIRAGILMSAIGYNLIANSAKGNRSEIISQLTQYAAACSGVMKRKMW